MSLLAENHSRKADWSPTRQRAATFVPDQSRAERTRSYAVADFAMPTGRARRSGASRRSTGCVKLFADEATGNCLDWGETLPAGVRLGTMSVADWQASGAPMPADRAAAWRPANTGGGCRRHSRRGRTHRARPAHPLTGADGALVHGHLLIRVGHHANATVILGHTGRAAYGEVVTIVAGDGAH